MYDTLWKNGNESTSFCGLFLFVILMSFLKWSKWIQYESNINYELISLIDFHFIWDFDGGIVSFEVIFHFISLRLYPPFLWDLLCTKYELICASSGIYFVRLQSGEVSRRSFCLFVCLFPPKLLRIWLFLFVILCVTFSPFSKSIAFQRCLILPLI